MAVRHSWDAGKRVRASASPQASHPSQWHKRHFSLAPLWFLFPRDPLRWARAGALLPGHPTGWPVFLFVWSEEPPLCKGRCQKSKIFDGGVVHIGTIPRRHRISVEGAPGRRAPPCEGQAGRWRADAIRPYMARKNTTKGLPACREASQSFIPLSAGSCRRPGRPPAR